MKRVVWLSSTLLTLVLILAGASVLILTTHPVEIDVTPFKQHIVAALLERTGLVFRVDGELRLRVGPRLGLEAQGLQAANPALPDAGDMLVADNAALEVETLPLLDGRVEPTFLRLEGAKIRLERDGSGRWSWQALSDDVSSGEEKGMAEAFFSPDALHTNVKDVQLLYRDRRSGTGFEAAFTTVDVEPTDEGLKIDLDGSVDGHPLRLRGSTATLSQLIEGTRPIPLDLEGNLLGLAVKATGTLANPRSGAQVSASLRVEGKSMAGLRPWVGEAIAAKGPVKATLDLKGGGKSYELAPFRLEVGKGRFDGALKMDLSNQRPGLDLDLGIEEVDLTPLLQRGQANGGDAAAGNKRAATDLFTDEPLSVSWMDALDLKANIHLRNLITPYTSMRDIDMEASVAAGNLSVKGAGKGEGGRSESFDLHLNAGADPHLASLRYKGEKLSIEPLLAATNARGTIRGEVDISVDVKATGNTGNRMASSLNGKLLFLVQHAKADLRNLDRMTPGVVNLFGLLTRPNADSAELNCGLAAFDFQGGRTKVNVLVDTPVSTVVAEGDLDLGAETLNIRVSPDAKGVHLKVAAPVVIQGPLASPDYSVEKGHLLVSLTELASKVAVPYLVLVDAFGDAVAENPCVKIASGKAEARQAGPLNLVTKPVETVTKGTGNLVKGTGAVVKDVGGAVVQGAGTLIKGVGGAVGGLLGGRRSEDDSGSDERRGQEGGSPFLDE